MHMSAGTNRARFRVGTAILSRKSTRNTPVRHVVTPAGEKYNEQQRDEKDYLSDDSSDSSGIEVLTEAQQRELDLRDLAETITMHPYVEPARDGDAFYNFDGATSSEEEDGDGTVGGRGRGRARVGELVVPGQGPGHGRVVPCGGDRPALHARDARLGRRAA
jgi:hypothetical protein